MRANRWTLAAISLPVLAAIVSLAIRIANPDSPDRLSLAGQPGIEHVHGLGVDPGDKSLIVATHVGSFRIRPDGGASRIGDDLQDTMGFTVAGPGRYLGSGHPEFKDIIAGAPKRLGLIESTDAGRSWTALSLSGKSDFHALQFSHQRVYGWDATSGAFMVSRDTTSWDVRSTVAIESFAVDPDDAEHMVGSGDGGLLESVDGGRSWAAGGGQPPALLSWGLSSGLWAAGLDGTLRRSDDGRAWRTVGPLPGPPQALLATGGTLYLASLRDEEQQSGAIESSSAGIFRSEDSGRSWILLYEDAGE